MGWAYMEWISSSKSRVAETRLSHCCLAVLTKMFDQFAGYPIGPVS